MTLNKKICLMFVVLGLFLPVNVFAGWAPSETIMVYVGYGAGGSIDTLSRVITKKISDNTGWNFTVINKPGGGGSVALKALKGAKADGLAICLSPSASITFTPNMNPKVGYTAMDFTPISAVSMSQGGIVSLSDKKWKDLGDVIAAVKSGENVSISYMSPKTGMMTKVIEKVAGIEFSKVPTKGGAAGLKNVLGGHVDLAWGGGVQSKYVKPGKMKMIAACEEERLTMAPDTPTLPELGFPQAVMSTMFTFLGPKGMKKDVVEALNIELRKAVESEAINDLIANKMSLKDVFIAGEELDKRLQALSEADKALIDFVKQ